MPNEPDKDDDLTINICFKFQITNNNDTNTNNNISRLYRRFYKSDTLILLVHFVESISLLPYYDSIEITTSYPKIIIYNSNNINTSDDRKLIDLNLDSNSIIWVSIITK